MTLSIVCGLRVYKINVLNYYDMIQKQKYKIHSNYHLVELSQSKN